MSTSSRRNALGKILLDPGIFPSISPGPLGINDAAMPFAQAFAGDSPGVLGKNDLASPDKRSSGPPPPSAQQQKQAYTNTALNLVEHYKSLAKLAGFNTAVAFFQFWRDGGDDHAGAARKDQEWKDEYGDNKKGKSISADVFWPAHRSRVEGHLRSSHRQKFIDGIQRRVKSGELAQQKWSVSLPFTDSVGNIFWPVNSDIQWAIGGCSITSIASITLQGVARGGASIDLNLATFNLQQGDRLTFGFTRWLVHLSDRFEWVHGTSQLPADMPLMDIEYWLTHKFDWKNPQDILHQLERKDSSLLYYHAGWHCYARPFDVVTSSVVVGDSPDLLAPFDVNA